MSLALYVGPFKIGLVVQLRTLRGMGSGYVSCRDGQLRHLEGHLANPKQLLTMKMGMLHS